MDELDTSSADAAILLGLQVEERVIAALVSVAVKDPRLSGMLDSNMSPETVLRFCISSIIVDVMRSPEFNKVLFEEMKTSLENSLLKETKRQRDEMLALAQMNSAATVGTYGGFLGGPGTTKPRTSNFGPTWLEELPSAAKR